MVKRLSLLVVVLAVASIAVCVTALPAGAVEPQDTDTTLFEPTWDSEMATNSTPSWAAPPEGALASDESTSSSDENFGGYESGHGISNDRIFITPPLPAPYW